VIFNCCELNEKWARMNELAWPIWRLSSDAQMDKMRKTFEYNRIVISYWVSNWITSVSKSSRNIYNYTTVFVQRVTASYFLITVTVCNTTIKKDWRVLGINLVTVLKTFRNILKLGQWMENINLHGSMMNFIGHYFIYTCSWLCCCPLGASIDTSFCKFVVISHIIYL